MRPASARQVAVATVALGALVIPIAHVGAGSQPDAEAMLAETRRATEGETFAGLVEVKWVDEYGEEHTARIGARSTRGRFVVGEAEHHVIGKGFERFTRTAGDVDASWVESEGREAPSPGESWNLYTSRRTEVADREASIITVRDDDGAVRARFAIDRESGQLLRREILDRRGNVVHSVGFVRIVSGPITPSVPTTPKHAPSPPEILDAAPAGYLVPDEIDGYRLLGVYRHPDGVVQVHYGDGVFTLSLFEQAGKIDWLALPEGRAHVDGLRDRAYATAVGTVVVWQQGDLVCTIVGDGPRDEVVAAVGALAGTTDSDWWDDVGDFLLGPFSWE